LSVELRFIITIFCR